MKKLSARVCTHPFPHGSGRLIAGFIVAVLAVFAFGSCEKPTDPAYTVTFNADGGTPAPADQSVTAGEKLTEPQPAPAKAGHVFGGWYKEAACTNQWDFAADTVTGNMTLYAKWNPNGYSVIFSVDGGTPAPESQTVGAEEKLTAPADMTKENYTFGGWYKEAACTNQWNFTTDTVTANMTLYAKWDPIKYTVTFNADGGTPAPVQVTVDYGSTITAPAAMSKSGYNFDAWYKESACTNQWNFTTDTVTDTTTLYAKWFQVYSLTLATASGQDNLGTVQITAGSAGTGQAAGSVSVQAAAAEGYTLEKWTSDVAGTTPVSTANPYTFIINANTTLYAVFKALPPGGEQSTSIIKGVEVKLRYVPAGSFQRDDQAGNISVITKGYWMAETAVTQELFEAIMGANPAYYNGSETSKEAVAGEIQNKLPVEYINWYAAIAFCNKLSLADGKEPVYSVTGVTNWESLTYSNVPVGGNTNWQRPTQDLTRNGYRLATEMEWMWAAMGADKTSKPNTTGYAKAFAGSTGTNDINDFVWYDTNSASKPHEVGKKQPNEIGLYDMNGNVWEWCWDWHLDYPSGMQTDYMGFATAGYRVQRGGAFNSTGLKIESRFRQTASTRGLSSGFRFVLPY